MSPAMTTMPDSPAVRLVVLLETWAKVVIRWPGMSPPRPPCPTAPTAAGGLGMGALVETSRALLSRGAGMSRHDDQARQTSRPRAGVDRCVVREMGEGCYRGGQGCPRMTPMPGVPE